MASITLSSEPHVRTCRYIPMETEATSRLMMALKIYHTGLLEMHLSLTVTQHIATDMDCIVTTFQGSLVTSTSGTMRRMTTGTLSTLHASDLCRHISKYIVSSFHLHPRRRFRRRCLRFRHLLLLLRRRRPAHLRRRRRHRHHQLLLSYRRLCHLLLARRRRHLRRRLPRLRPHRSAPTPAGCGSMDTPDLQLV